jgi:hypothetical protein
VFSAFTTKNGLKEENASSPSPVSFALEYAISEVEQHRVRTEWGTSAYGDANVLGKSTNIIKKNTEMYLMCV